MGEKLKTCPFCDCPAMPSMDANPVVAKEMWVECVGCGARGPKRYIHKFSPYEFARNASVTAWNTRPDIRRETIEECANAVGAISHRHIISRVCAMSTIRALTEDKP